MSVFEVLAVIVGGAFVAGVMLIYASMVLASRADDDKGDRL